MTNQAMHPTNAMAPVMLAAQLAKLHGGTRVRGLAVEAWQQNTPSPSPQSSWTITAVVSPQLTSWMRAASQAPGRPL